MKVSRLIIFLCFTFTAFCINAQDSLPIGKALNFPFKKYGLSVGNSIEFNGLRINFRDTDVKRINGINISFWIPKKLDTEAVANGINIGITPYANRLQPLNIGLIGVGSYQKGLNGLSVGGLVMGSGGNINGISISGLFTTTFGDDIQISGISVSGFAVAANKGMNGLMLAGVAIGTDGNINGIAASLALISAKNSIRGLSVTLGCQVSNSFYGLSVAAYSKTTKFSGISIALINKSDELKGLQIGLWNYAGNNKRWLKRSPFVNAHFF